MPSLSADGRLLLATCAVRNLAYGFLSVLLGLYLAAHGFDAAAIGAVFAAALIGGALMTMVLAGQADRLGRRRVLMVGSLLMALSGAVFAASDNPLVLGLAAVIGTISPSGKDVGPFLSLEQAVLPQATTDDRRTGLFALYNLVGALAGALGALLVGLPTLAGLDEVPGFRLLIGLYAGLGLALIPLYARLSPAVEVTRPVARPDGLRGAFGLRRSGGLVARLAGLLALDAFGGGFIVQSLIAYWLHLRYGVDLAALGAIFSASSLLVAVSFLAAAPLARRFGLLRTLVFTHLPSNLLLLVVPLAPNVELAAAALLARSLLAQLDVPTRQSYIMAVVPPDERAAAAGLTGVARNAATALAPALAGQALANPALGLPFFIAGSLKIVYDLAMFATFRHVHPPEELARANARQVARGR